MRAFCVVLANLLVTLGLAVAFASAEKEFKLDITNLPTSLQEKISQQFPEVQVRSLSLTEAERILKWLHIAVDFDFVQLWEIRPHQLEYRIIKRSRIKTIQWEGLAPISERESLRLLNVEIDDVYQTDLIDQGVERIKKAFEELGYLNVRIEARAEVRQDEHFDLVISIDRGTQTKIDKIQIDSPNKFLNEGLRKSLKSFINEPLTQDSEDRLSKSAKEYLIEERYSRAELIGPEVILNPQKSNAILKFKIDQIDKYEFLFRGNFNYTSLNLSENLNLDNFYSANSNIGAELSQKLRIFYQKEGYARVDVSFEEREDRTKFQKYLTFNIIENPRIKIDKIQISGKMSRKESYYIDLLTKNASPLFKKGYYSREDIEVAVNSLKVELQTQGFLLAKIIAVRTPLGRDKNKVPVFITIDEGPLTRIESIAFEGNMRIPAGELLSVSGLYEAGPLRLGYLDTAIQKIKAHYKDLGFLEMILSNEVTDLVSYSHDNTRAKVVFRIFEGPQVRVASIVLDGNSFTRDRVIFNEIDFSVGEILNPQKIEESTYRLQKTGYFSSVEIRTLEEKTAVAERTVIIRVTERDPGLFSMGLGVTNERKLTLRGYTGIAYRNLLGTGRGISFRVEANYNVAEINYPEFKATVGYLEPYLFETRNRGRINLTRARLVTEAETLKASESIQTSLSVERDLSSHVIMIWDAYSLSSSRDYFLDPSLPALRNTNTQESLLDIATTGFSFDIDFRNNIFNPTAGHITKFNIEYGSPALRSSETIEYWRATGGFTHYQPVYKNSVVWTNSLRLGYLRNLNTTSNGGVPYDKKGFILGGRSTIRGFEAGTNEVFPNSNDLGVPPGKTFLLTESSAMGLIKSELSFPLRGVISGAIFYDGGTVRLTQIQFVDPYRDSAGFGIRYNTPVGPLSLDMGWKLDQKPGEDAALFHLSFGTL